MRIWDINPGYLSRDLLLAEHRILHETVTLVTRRKSEYRSQESMRWDGFGWALRQRHGLLVAELNLRGFADITPVMTRSGKDQWPSLDSEEPIAQLQMLADEYATHGEGRIPLPDNAQQLWAQHKYSVMARDQALYRRTGKRVAGMRRKDDYADLAHRLTLALQRPPSEGGLRNALQQMWGHVSDSAESLGDAPLAWQPAKLLREIQHRALESGESHLLASTALGELPAWVGQG